MANDRMYMRCRACGDMLMLGKHNMTGWYKVPEGDALQTWIEKHAPLWAHECEYDKTTVAKDGHAVFEIHYESDDDYEPQEDGEYLAFIGGRWEMVTWSKKDGWWLRDPEPGYPGKIESGRVVKWAHLPTRTTDES